jgi:hypothetical protein
MKNHLPGLLYRSFFAAFISLLETCFGRGGQLVFFLSLCFTEEESFMCR